jgi:hypothetical protein
MADVGAYIGAGAAKESPSRCVTWEPGGHLKLSYVNNPSLRGMVLSRFDVLKEGRTLDNFVRGTPRTVRRRPYVDETGDHGRRR